MNRTDTYFCSDLSVTAVVIKVSTPSTQQASTGGAIADVSCLDCRVWQSTRMSWALLCVLAVIMTIRKWRQSRDFGTAPVFPCVSAR